MLGQALAAGRLRAAAASGDRPNGSSRQPYPAHPAGTAPSLPRTEYWRAAPRRAARAATSRRTAHQAGSPLSAARARCRQTGSSCAVFLGEQRRDIERVALQLLDKADQAMVGDALRVENAVQVIALVLYDPSVKAGGLAFDRAFIQPDRGVADPQMARHDPA